MSAIVLREKNPVVCIQAPEERESVQPQLIVGLLTGGQDRHYAFGLAMALIAKDVRLDVIGSDSLDSPEMHNFPKLRFLNLYGNQQETNVLRKIKTTLAFYVRLIRYAKTATPRIFHILWNNKFQIFDRTLLMLYYKVLGKKIVFTAHNVNAGRRDSRDSLLNRLTLECQYRLADHIFVHTEKMKNELLNEFHVSETAVTILRYGVNNAVQDTDLTSVEAKQRLGIGEGEKTILFFGAIKPYKGLEYLVAAFQQIATTPGEYRLIIAGERKKGSEEYLTTIQQTIDRDRSREQVIQKIGFIPDHETELYFKAADVAVLPYTEIFQSGILFLAYRFGLPVIATDVGSFAEEIVEGRTGFVCRPRDPDDIAAVIQRYFESALFTGLGYERQRIREYALSRHSWDAVGELTQNVYLNLLDVGTVAIGKAG